MRTPEQVAADDALTEALTRVLAAYEDDDAVPYVLTEYIVVGAHHRYDDEGDPVTAVSTLFRDGDVPTHRALGLVEFARARLIDYINGGD